MPVDHLNRRDFQRYTSAALGGLLAAGVTGCSGNANQPPGGAPPTAGTDSTSTAEGDALLLEEPHVCRGLNTCQGLGASGDNACAGQGTCASAAHHACAGHNECKGQGGCGLKDGANACKGQGGCEVPLAHGWKGARARFEAAMQAAGKDFGPAPDPS